MGFWAPYVKPFWTELKNDNAFFILDSQEWHPLKEKNNLLSFLLVKVCNSCATGNSNLVYLRHDFYQWRRAICELRTINAAMWVTTGKVIEREVGYMVGDYLIVICNTQFNFRKWLLFCARTAYTVRHIEWNVTTIS